MCVCRIGDPSITVIWHDTVKQTPGSEVPSTTIKVNGLTVQQFLFESVGVCQSLHCRSKWKNQ